MIDFRTVPQLCFRRLTTFSPSRTKCNKTVILLHIKYVSYCYTV